MTDRGGPLKTGALFLNITTQYCKCCKRNVPGVSEMKGGKTVFTPAHESPNLFESVARKNINDWLEGGDASAFGRELES